VRLEEVRTDDLDWIARALESWSRTQRWSLRGQTPSPAMMRRLVHDHVSLQRVVRHDAGTPVAVVQLADVDGNSGNGQVALLADPHRLAEVRPSLTEFVATVFAETDLRKLCVLAHADELDVPAVFGPAATPIGRLVAHERRAEDDYADLLLFEIWRPS
jgi:hypothetical protein